MYHSADTNGKCEAWTGCMLPIRRFPINIDNIKILHLAIYKSFDTSHSVSCLNVNSIPDACFLLDPCIFL